MSKKDRIRKCPVITVELSEGYEKTRVRFHPFYEASHRVFSKWWKEYPHLSLRESGGAIPYARFCYAGRPILTAVLVAPNCGDEYLMVNNPDFTSRHLYPPFENGIEGILDIFLRIRINDALDLLERERRERKSLTVSESEMKIASGKPL